MSILIVRVLGRGLQMWLSIRNAIGLNVMKKLGVNRPQALVWGVSTLAVLATLLYIVSRLMLRGARARIGQ